MTTAAIMQPTYLPWCGYMALIESVDEFVLLDTVQFAKRSWQQRNQIKTRNGPLWLTVPVVSKGLRNQKICDVKIDTERDFPQRHIRTIELNLSKTPFFYNYTNELVKILESNYDHLLMLTKELIIWLCKSLNINTRLRLASELDVSGSKADLLASICKRLGADTYLSPPGSKSYLDQTNVLENNNIELSYFNYIHPTYQQMYGEFMPYMSIIDLLFNCGPKSKAILLSGNT
jgi:hypothetical protein